MKMVAYILLSLFVALIVFAGIMIYSPHLTPPSTADPIVKYDANYFFDKISSDKISFFEKNKFVITEEELTGHLSYKFKKDGLLRMKDGLFTPNDVEVNLYPDRLNLIIYGTLGFLPTNFQITFNPHYDKATKSIILYIEKVRMGRLKLPQRIVNNLQIPSLGDNHQLVIPIETPREILIEDIHFNQDAIIIYYKIHSKQIIDELFNNIKSLFRR